MGQWRHKRWRGYISGGSVVCVIRMPNVAEWIGHKYLGPGNPYPNGKPVDKADKVAQAHDKFYTDLLKVADVLSKEEYKEKVHEADIRAIEEFIANFREDGDDWDWWSAAGAVGLNSKLAVERAIGRILYPRQSSVAGNYGWIF